MPLPSTARTGEGRMEHQRADQQESPCHLSALSYDQAPSSSLPAVDGDSPPRRASAAGTVAANHIHPMKAEEGGLGYINSCAYLAEVAAEPPCCPNGDRSSIDDCVSGAGVVSFSGAFECNGTPCGPQSPGTAKAMRCSDCDHSGRAALPCCVGAPSSWNPLERSATRKTPGAVAPLPQSPLCVEGGERMQQPHSALLFPAAGNATAVVPAVPPPPSPPQGGGGGVVRTATAGWPAEVLQRVSAADSPMSPGRVDVPPPPPRPDTPSSFETHSAAAAAVAAGLSHGHEMKSPSSSSRPSRRSHSISAHTSPAQQQQPQPQLDSQPPSPHQQQQQMRFTPRNHGPQASPGVDSRWPAATAAAAAVAGIAGHPQSWSVQQQQHQLLVSQQQQQQQLPAAVVAAGLPLLAVPAAALPYTPWGPVLPAIHVPQAAVAVAAAAVAAGAGVAISPFATLPLAVAASPAGPTPPEVTAAAAAPGIGQQSGFGAHQNAVLQLPAAPGGPQAPPPAPAAAPQLTLGSSADSEALASQCRLAGVLRQSGKAAEALALLDGVLLRQPTNVEALHLRAQCQQALGQVQEAMSTHLRALALAPDHIPSLTALGALYQSQGLLGDAVAVYRRSHELRPDDPTIRVGLAVVLTDQGTKLKNAGAPVAEAVSRYQAAVSLCPNYAPALYNLGVVAGELRQGDAALEYYRAAIAAEPRYAQAHCNLGVLLRERGRVVEAVAAYEAALAAAPNFTIVRNNLAIALTDLGTHIKNEGRLDEGIALYERALSYAPRHADALYNLGVAYGEKGDLQRAAFMYEMALAFNPACAEAQNNLGVIWKEQDNIERAVECYSAALAIRPSFPQSLNNLGVVMTAQGRAADALTLLMAAVNGSPTYTEAHNNLGVLQRDVGCIPEALASYSRCLELDPHCRNAGQNRLLALNYIYPGEAELVSSAHREWGELFQSTVQPLPPLGPGDRSRDPDRPLRIGYISPDLFTHSVSYFAEAPLTHHAPGRGYQHFVYSCVPKPDAKTARLRAGTEAAGGVWREVARLSEGELAELVRRDEIDLLVELTGHTANNRLGVMARRPAPVQLTWIGYPNSTGLKAVDYRLTDQVCDPWTTEQTFVEELVRLPGCFLCYTPALDAPPVAPPPALANGYITFGSFNNLAKITPQVLRLWGAILAAVPRSRLVLKNKPFACEAARAHVLQQLAAVGVEPWRVDLLPLAPGNAQHLATYSLMDISLDPFPYAGTTTTTESLYMGVPCLTLAGRCHAHNVGVSLLTAVGLHCPSAPNTKTHCQHSQQQHPQYAQQQAAAAAASAGTSTLLGAQPAVGSDQGQQQHHHHHHQQHQQQPPQLQHLQEEGGEQQGVGKCGEEADGSSGSDLTPRDMAVESSTAAAATVVQKKCPTAAAAAAGAAAVGAGTGATSPVAPVCCCCSSCCSCHRFSSSSSSSPSSSVRPGWVAHSETEYVALAVAHASDVKALAELRSSLRERMLSSPLCDGPAFLRRLEGVYRALWRRHCAALSGDAAAAEAAAVAAGLRRPTSPPEQSPPDKSQQRPRQSGGAVGQ